MELDTATDPDERVTRGVTVAPITLSASISIQPCRRRDAYPLPHTVRPAGRSGHCRRGAQPHDPGCQTRFRPTNLMIAGREAFRPRSGPCNNALSRQKTRPRHPLSDPQAQAAFAKGGSRALEAAAAAHPDKGRTGYPGGCAASRRAGSVIAASTGPISTPRSVRPPATASPSCCPRSRRRR